MRRVGRPPEVLGILPSPILKAVTMLGGYEATGLVCDVSGKAVMKWVKQGYLPRTEWSGETNYASALERATRRRVTRKQLLAVRPPPKPSWRKRRAEVSA